MKVEKLLDVLSAYSKEEWNFHWRKCWKGHTKVSFFIFKRHTHQKRFTSVSWQYLFPISLFLMRAQVYLWILVFYIFSFSIYDEGGNNV